jgi:hypothetical protein
VRGRERNSYKLFKGFLGIFENNFLKGEVLKE